MSRRRDRRISLRVAAALLALSAGGCSLLIGSELSGKPAATSGAGGSGGEPGVTTGAGGTGNGGKPAGAGGGVGPGGPASSSGGGPTCPKGTADCDGNPMNACNTDLKNDPRNCGACGVVCQPPEDCQGGKCK